MFTDLMYCWADLHAGHIFFHMLLYVATTQFSHSQHVVVEIVPSLVICYRDTSNFLHLGTSCIEVLHAMQQCGRFHIISVGNIVFYCLHVPFQVKWKCPPFYNSHEKLDAMTAHYEYEGLYRFVKINTHMWCRILQFSLKIPQCFPNFCIVSAPQNLYCMPLNIFCPTCEWTKV